MTEKKFLKCQLCGEVINKNALYDHLLEQHDWQEITEDQTSNKRPMVKVEKNKKQKKPGYLPTSLLTCPYCSKRFKRKQTLIAHISACDEKKDAKVSNIPSTKGLNHTFSFEWACKQKLDEKYNNVVKQLVLDKTEEFLSKEIDALLTKLDLEPSNQSLKQRLILISKAKQKALKKSKKLKVNKQKNKIEKTDAMDFRVPGSWGSGRNR